MIKNTLIFSVFTLFVLSSCKETISNEKLIGEWKTTKFEVIDKKNVLHEAAIEAGRIVSLAVTYKFYEDSTYDQFLWKNKVQKYNMRKFGKFEIDNSKKLLYLFVDTAYGEKDDSLWRVVKNIEMFKSSYETKVYKIINLNEDEMKISEKEKGDIKCIYTLKR